MKTLVLYQSTTGYTKKIAEWIAKNLNANLQSADEPINFENYDLVIFGGPLMAGTIKGLKVIKNCPKPQIVFATGLLDLESSKIEKLFSDNKLSQIPHFYFRGGLNMQELSLPSKIAMNVIKIALMSKKEKTKSDLSMIKAFDQPTDFTNRESIEALIAIAKNLVNIHT